VIGLLPTIFAATEGSQGIAALGLDPLAILAQTVTFLLVFWLLKKFALNKIVATLETRRKTIDKGVLLGREMEAEKAKLDEQIEARLKEARQEADKILAGAARESNEVMKAAEEKAAKKTEAMIAEARTKMSEDLKRARTELEKEMLSLIAEATEAIIHEKLDTAKDNALIANALKEAQL
jgi:F-type H+-transporting ATPase subunit b